MKIFKSENLLGYSSLEIDKIDKDFPNYFKYNQICLMEVDKNGEIFFRFRSKRSYRKSINDCSIFHNITKNEMIYKLLKQYKGNKWVIKSPVYKQTYYFVNKDYLRLKHTIWHKVYEEYKNFMSTYKEIYGQYLI